MFCAKCGNEIIPGTKFCSKCGAPLPDKGTSTGTTASTASGTPGGMSANPRPGVQPAGSGMPGGQKYMNNGMGEPPKKKKPVGLIIAIVAAALVLVAVIVGGIFLLKTNGEDVSDSDEWTSQQESDKKSRDFDDEDDAERDDGENLTDNRADNESVSTESDAPAVEEPIEPKAVDISIRQVDNSKFPEVTFYANVMDLVNHEIVDGLTASDFDIREYDVNGNLITTKIKDVHKVDTANERISMNLVLDASGSMDDSDKMPQAKNAAQALVAHMNLSGGDQIELISFDDYVYLKQSFTSDSSKLTEAIDAISTGGSTALYDGLYSGIYQTNMEDGVKCVVGFTDGEENASSYSYDDVVNLSRETGIPVYIIGVGGDVNASILQSLATECSGCYYTADASNLETVLQEIYFQIYQSQKDYYVFSYESSDKSRMHEFRTIELMASDHSHISGSFKKEYVPESDVNGNFADDYANQDYILDFSGSREVTSSDLNGLSLAELRIARNEIFARHGRQFNDPMLNQWFYSKQWYLDIPQKYSPDDFDKNNRNPLSSQESKNADFIRAYEDEYKRNNDIYPEASAVQLSGYDLALDKATLKMALKQVKGYAQTDIRDENIRLIKEAIDQEEIKY